MKIGTSSEKTQLDVDRVTIAFGGVVALCDVCFTVPRGTICGLIGPNGAGKTTIFNCISRLYHPSSGRILYNGIDLLGMPAHKIAGVGIGRTFQNLAMFKNLTVLQNILVGAHARTRTSFLENLLRLPSVSREEVETLKTANRLVQLLELEPVLTSAVDILPFGIQKRVEIARALASSPSMLLLDEPAAGLNQEEIESLTRMIRYIRDALDITILLVEHHMGVVMSVCDKIIVLDFGKVIADGPPGTVRDHPGVIEAYLGVKL